MIRLGVYAFLATFIVLTWPIVAVIIGVVLLWRLYPKGA